jgi:[acyl-carrier-protein] S-malonyltransferase
MGKRVCELFPFAVEYFTAASDEVGWDVGRLCFEGPEDELRRTDRCQVALYAVGYVTFCALQAAEMLPPVGACLGQSLGEWTALTAAGAIAYEDGIKFVSLRGKLMDEACRCTPGAMASLLGGTEENAIMLCEKSGVQLSNFNAPDQIVISGETEKITIAIRLSREFGFRRAISLSVAGAYHSRLMQSAQDELSEEIKKLKIHPPHYAVFSNVTGKLHGNDGDGIRRLLLEQITAPVRWSWCMAGAIAMGVQLFYECGPGNVLTNLCRKNAPMAKIFQPNGY